MIEKLLTIKGNIKGIRWMNEKELGIILASFNITQIQMVLDYWKDTKNIAINNRMFGIILDHLKKLRKNNKLAKQHAERDIYGI